MTRLWNHPSRSALISLVRAAAIGAATGARSMTGLAAVSLTSSRADRGSVPSRLGSPAGSVVVSTLAAAEVGLDKFPAAPSRLSAPGLVPRLILGAGTAAVVAHRDGQEPALPGVIGLLAAWGGAVLGTRARSAAERRWGSDLPGAVVEDVVAACLGWFGARRRRDRSPELGQGLRS